MSVSGRIPNNIPGGINLISQNYFITDIYTYHGTYKKRDSCLI